MVADATAGHNIVATVYVDSNSMYRRWGSPEERSLGEIEFATGIGAMSDSGLFGTPRICAAIVGNVDLTLGERVEAILEKHLAVGGRRYRGIRCGAATAYNEDLSIIGTTKPGLLADREFRSGLSRLAHHGLAFDVFILDPQLRDLAQLAHSLPNQPFVLNHLGAPVRIGRFASFGDENFGRWKRGMANLAAQPNVFAKLGGLGLPLAALPGFNAKPQAASVQLADEWRPYIETTIELFGTRRCMFESNFPVDSATCSYVTLWNAFKRVVSGASQSEKNDLFYRTAAKVYRLEVQSDSLGRDDRSGNEARVLY
jgi:predicted TIM-barrel fold metal-dependent hydrolase